MASFLVVFDFDHTIVDCNSDVTVPRALGREHDQQMMMEEKVQWTDMMSTLLAPFDEPQIRAAIRDSIVVQPEMKNVFELLQREKDNGRVEIAVASDANTLFIEETFAHHFCGVALDAVHSNPIRFFQHPQADSKKCEVVWYSGRRGHDCAACNAAGRLNMCKSNIILELLRSTKLVDPIVVFVGDGANDHCPVMRVLRTRDYCFVRSGMALAAKVGKPNCAGVCHKAFWNDAGELRAAFERVVAAAALPLPPQYLFIDDVDGESVTFRTKTLQSRMPLLVQRTIDANVATWRANDGEETAAFRAALLSELANSARCNSTLEGLFAAFSRICGFSSAHHGAPLKALLLDQPWIKNYARRLPSALPSATSSAVTQLRWGDLPWLEGEVLFNVTSVVLCHALLVSSGDDESEAVSTATKPAIVIAPNAGLELPFWSSSDLPTTTLGFSALMQDVYAEEKANSVAAFLHSQIIPMVANPQDWQGDAVDEVLAAILRKCLWGNAVDLSMFQLHHLKEQQNGKGNDDRLGDARVVANDFDVIARLIQARLITWDEAEPLPPFVDIIQDNVGVECAADLLLALFIVHRNPSVTVRLHVKPIPHYVSDTMRHDIDALVEAVRREGGSAVLPFCEAMEAALKVAKRIEVHTDGFWASPGEFRTMPPTLCSRFFFDSVGGGGNDGREFFFVPKSRLVIVKGDLNFRRLVGDRRWERGGRTVTLKRAVQDYWPSDVVPIVALRTLKSEVCVGPTHEKIAELDGSADRDSWRVSGAYAVAVLAHV